MNNDEIIHHKIATLSGHDTDQLTVSQKQQINDNPALQKELAFIETLWQPEAVSLDEPTEQLDAKFYKMLASAQASPSRPSQRRSWGQWVQKVLWGAPAFQVCALVVVFLIGFNLNTRSSDESKLALLNEQVSSLNTMMAITMLQQTSASEQLAGVAYSQEADLKHERLSSLLLQTLSNENSAPVKLAIINTLSRAPISHIEKPLIEIATNQSSVLVQIELIRLLIAKGSNQSIETLMHQLSQETLHPDVNQLLQAPINKSANAA